MTGLNSLRCALTQLVLDGLNQQEGYGQEERTRGQTVQNRLLLVPGPPAQEERARDLTVQNRLGIRAPGPPAPEDCARGQTVQNLSPGPPVLTVQDQIGSAQLLLRSRPIQRIVVPWLLESHFLPI